MLKGLGVHRSIQNGEIAVGVGGMDNVKYRGKKEQHESLVENKEISLARARTHSSSV